MTGYYVTCCEHCNSTILLSDKEAENYKLWMGLAEAVPCCDTYNVYKHYAGNQIGSMLEIDDDEDEESDRTRLVLEEENGKG